MIIVSKLRPLLIAFAITIIAGSLRAGAVQQPPPILPPAQLNSPKAISPSVEKRPSPPPIEQHIAPQTNYQPFVTQEPVADQDPLYWLPYVGVKTNLLYGALAFAPNLSLEIALGLRSSIEIGYSYNWFNQNGTTESNKKLIHYLAWAEYRFWIEEPFDGHFFGAHALGGEYNISQHNLHLLFGCNSNEYRYLGWAAGGGLSYGYQWILAPRWRAEATVGIGYAYLQYNRYDGASEGAIVATGESRHYVGLTKLGVSLMFLF